ncbi:MAG: carboxypeptidase regulatory-like domain-containing protein [Acidobacteriia bacterium]|nr:carboxypeptidase regulatory-like domain-containing protein [Terriglobia bacterium]
MTGVVKGGNDQPIAGAAVVLAQAFMLRGAGAGGRGSALLGMAGGGAPERGSDTTGGDGKFAVRGVAPGEYVLTVKRSGFATERVDPVKVPKSGAPAPLVVTLAPGATISGRVVRRSGSGAEGFLVRATSPGLPRFDAAATTDQATGPDGMFSLDGLKPGQSYDLQLLGPVGLGEGKHGVVAPAPNVVLTAAGPGRITGRALDAADGHPIAQFQVSYEAARGVGAFRGGPRGGALGAGGGAAGAAGQPVDVESGDGTFALDDVPAGTWSVVVTAKGYQPGRTAGVEVAEGETDDGVEVRLAAGTTVKGHVVDGTSGAPVVNASVSIDSAGAARGRGPIPAEMRSGDITTDADGRFEIEGVATGKQPLHVTHPDYADATQIVQVADEGAVVEVRMTQGGVLAGTVASDTGQPVPGANVALNQAGSGGFGFGGGAGAQMNVTDTAGQFRFDHLGAGRYTVTASLGSHTSSPVEVVLQAGQSQQDLVLQLQVGVTIQGTVSGLPTTMVTGMTVGANGPDSYVQSMRLGADGAFEFDNVPLGVVTLRGTATDPTGSTRSTTKQVTTSADQPVLTVELAFDTGFSLSGRVTQAGQPVGGAMVFASLQGGGGRQASATTDDDGSYRLNDLQEGTYAVNAMSAQAGASRRQTVALDSDQTLDIVFPSAKIAGQVVDADSKMPLANASVTIRPQDPNATGGVGQRPATTDTSGQFSFTGLDEATYTLSTSRADYQVDTRDTTATAQGTDGLVTALKRAAGIGVKVQDGLSGVPLPSVMVRVFDGQGTPVFGPTSVSLDTSGQGEIPSLPPGTYSVIAGSSGYAPVRLDGVTVPSASVMIFLTPGGTILIQAGPKTLAQGTATGTITSAAGQPALLSLFNLQGRFAISEPDLQLHNVPPGSYVLSLPTVEVSQPFAVGEGGATTVQLP